MDQPSAVTRVFTAEDLSEPPVVLQASGMLAIRLGLNCPAALDHMRRYATRTEQPLPKIAQAVIVNRFLDLRE